MDSLESTVPSPSTARRPAAGRSLLAWCLGVGLFAALLLAAYAPLFQPGRLHIAQNFVDQAQYITTARTFLDTGQLKSGILYPAYIANDDWRPYMPGSYLPLILSYGLFGFGIFQSQLPALSGFVLGAIGVFLAANRLYGRGPGLLAAAFFCLFPGNLCYAWTALTEQPFGALCILLFALFLAVPERWKLPIVPLLLGVAFLYRETGVLILIPMGVWLLHARPGLRTLGAVALVTLVSALVLYGLNQWQLSTGKGKVPLSWVLYGKFNYGDAFPNPPPALSVGEWIEGFTYNAQRNALTLRGHFRSDPTHFRFLGFVFSLGAILLTTVLSPLRWRRDPMPLAAGALGLVLLAMQLLLYDVKGQKALRTTMFVFPFCAVALGGSLYPTEWLKRARSRTRSRIALLLGALVLVAGSVYGASRAGDALRRTTEVQDRALEVLEQIRHDPNKVLIAPFEIMMAYSVSHYPVKVSFPPTNQRTLEAIMDRFEVGTLILPTSYRLGRITDEFLEENGFGAIGKVAWILSSGDSKAHYNVYRRP